MPLCIYKHTLNDKIYIGQTRQSIKSRTLSGHGYLTCPHFYNAIKKYGWQNVSTEILALCAEQKEADFLEQFYIMEYKSWDRNYGYNLKLGGSNGRHSEETKMKISDANKDPSEETRMKISNARKGRVYSEETRMKMSIAHKGKVFSEETRMKMSNANKGRVHSKE